MSTTVPATVEYDPEVDAWYIDLAPHVEYRQAVDDGSRRAILDYAPDGTLAGIEIL